MSVRIPEEEVGRPYLSSGRAVLERARLNESVRSEFLKKIVSADHVAMRPEPCKFDARDLSVIKEFARNALPHLLDEIEFAIKMYKENQQRNRKGRGRPSTLRCALAVDFLKRCGKKSATEEVASAFWKHGINIEADSVERNYRRHKKAPFFDYALLHRLHELAHL